MMRLIYLYVCIIFSMGFLYGDEYDDKLKRATDSVVDKAKSIGQMGSSMWEGLKESVGIVGPEYKYSFRVFNDTPNDIYALSEDIVNIFSMDFNGEISGHGTDHQFIALIHPFSDSGDYFQNIQQKIAIWLTTDDKKLTQYAKNKNDLGEYALKGMAVGPVGSLGAVMAHAAELNTRITESHFFYRYIQKAKYSDVFYYRAYSVKDAIRGEYLGVKGTTSQFAGIFHNDTPEQEIFVQFKKDGVEYKANLEANSFNFLESTTTVSDSIRPRDAKDIRGFTFFNGAKQIAFIPVTPNGIANMSYDEQSKTWQMAGPMSYTYEVYTGKNGISVGIQGLSIGTYSEPSDRRIRDLNPMDCNIWLKSAAQADQPSASQMAVNLPEQVWLTYKTKDFVLQKKLTPGTVYEEKILRPRIQEGTAWMYIVSIQTDDDAKAKKFIDRLSDGKIKIQTTLSLDLAEQKKLKTALTQVQPNTNGFIDDTKGADSSGVVGALLFSADYQAYGVGVGPFYYTIEPALIQISPQLFHLNDTLYKKEDPTQLTDEALKDLKSKISAWILNYPKNKQGVVNEIRSFLLDKGNNAIFKNPDASAGQRTLNQIGEKMITLFVSGVLNPEKYPQEYPIIRQSGKNYYIYGLGQKPQGWPK